MDSSIQETIYPEWIKEAEFWDKQLNEARDRLKLAQASNNEKASKVARMQLGLSYKRYRAAIPKALLEKWEFEI